MCSQHRLQRNKLLTSPNKHPNDGWVNLAGTTEKNICTHVCTLGTYGDEKEFQKSSFRYARGKNALINSLFESLNFI